jgi:hypothetical protein
VVVPGDDSVRGIVVSSKVRRLLFALVDRLRLVLHVRAETLLGLVRKVAYECVDGELGVRVGTQAAVAENATL